MQGLRSFHLRGLLVCCLLLLSVSFIQADFDSNWGRFPDQVWVGPELWANRLHDWAVKNGRLECLNDQTDKPVRTVHLLTHRLGDNCGDFQMTVQTGPLNASFGSISESSSSGFLIAAGPLLEYRAASLVHHTCGKGGGMLAGVNGQGRLFFSDFSVTKEEGVDDIGKTLVSSEQVIGSVKNVVLRLSAEPSKDGYKLVLTALSPETDKELASLVLSGVAKENLTGNVGLFSNPGTSPGNTRFWFEQWQARGGKFTVNTERICGPILSAVHTVDNHTLNLAAQMMPLSVKCGSQVQLQVKRNDGWQQIAVSRIETPAYIAVFRIKNWPVYKNVPYRVVYELETTDGVRQNYHYTGTVRKVPFDRDDIVICAFTGNHNVERPGIDRSPTTWTFEQIWFPHNDLISMVEKHSPDLLFFSGDQVYETASPTKADMSSLENIKLDYLYKWYLWCWTYRDLCRDIPAIIIPDDHDVYQGNLWGAGGRHAERQEDGGYVHPPEFVNMVQRTQTANLPEPYDPRPAEQGIGVYYTCVNYAGVSFAVIEDRKFKSSAKAMAPEGKVINQDRFSTEGFDPKTDGDIKGAELLGQRQLKFLEEWAVDYSNGVWAKVLLSQTLFSHLQTFPRGYSNKSQDFLLKNGNYPEDDRFITNTDSNGWPQTGRNLAIMMIRRGFAFHIAGDTHLGSTIQYGVDSWGDSPFAMCVPSVANFWPRRWCPPFPGKDRKPDMPRYTGNYEDSFGNLMTVYAVSNPKVSHKEPSTLYDRATGYGIAKLNRQTRDITFTLWPRWVDPCQPGAEPYEGWPVKFNQMDNYDFAERSYLPVLKVSGLLNPVVQVVDEKSNKILYAVRIAGNTFTPRVPDPNTEYTVKIGEPQTGEVKIYTGIKPASGEENRELSVQF